MRIVADALDVVGIEGDRVEQAAAACACGSAPETTARASDLLARRRGRRRRRARPSQQTRSTVAPVRISAPKPRAAAARASGQRAEAALHEHGRRAGGVAVAGGGLEQQVRGRARRPRAGDQSLDAARRARRRAGARRLEPLRREIGDRHRSPAQQAVAVLAAEARGTPSRGRRAGTARAARGARRRAASASSRRREHAPIAAERRVELGVARRRRWRENAARSRSRCAPGRRRGVRPRPSGSGANTRGSGCDQLEPVPVRGRGRRDELGRSGPGRVGDGRGPEAGVELLGDGRAADDVAPLEHERLAARPSRASAAARRGRWARRR